MTFKINSLSVKKLVEFTRLSERSRTTFANNLKIPKKPKSEDDSGGGDYWIRSTSGVSNAYKYNDSVLVQEKIDDVLSVYGSTEIETTKTMYKRNLDILHKYIDFDFSIWRPSADLQFLSRPKITLSIKDVPIEVFPSHVFTYTEDKLYVGGIWLVCWLQGFRPSDLGIFSESLFRYLSLMYSPEFEVNPNYCLAVDVIGKEVVNYQQILDGTIPSLLDSSVDILNKYI